MQHSSARSLARCPYFNSWATGALLRQREIPLDAATTEFNQLTVFKLPKHFTYHPKVSQNGEGDFYASLKEWASNNTGSVHNPKHDPDKLGEVSKNLSLAYWITCDAVDSKASESAQRRGVDILVQLAFAIRLGANHEVRLEQELQVCRSAWRGRSVGSKAIADTAVVMAIPGDKMDEVVTAVDALGLAIADRDERRLFWTTNPTRPNKVILFLGEFKKTEGDRNQNQLVLGFGTVQYQRRCLGLPNAVIWGITCAEGNLKVYSSMWTDDHPSLIYWPEHHTWNLTVPIDFLRFYSFLCKLSDKPKDTVGDLAALDAATSVQRTKDIVWRDPPDLMLFPPTPSKRKRLEDSQPTAGQSGEAAIEEPEYMDVEELVGGACGLSERDSSLSEGDNGVEGDEKKTRTKATKMPVPLEEGCVYQHLHALPRDLDWWKTYAGVK